MRRAVDQRSASTSTARFPRRRPTPQQAPFVQFDHPGHRIQGREKVISVRNRRVRIDYRRRVQPELKEVAQRKLYIPMAHLEHRGPQANGQRKKDCKTSRYRSQEHEEPQPEIDNSFA